MRFIDAQLLITSQATSERVPFLAGALGLTYPEYPVFSVRGGMLRYARFLEDRIHSFGGEIAYRQRVVSVTREGRSWSVRSKQGRTFTAPVVISSLPIFNLPAILEGEPERYVSRIVRRIERSGASLWGAFTLYALVPSNVAGVLPINLQVVLPRTLKHCGSSTLFCSFSHPDDTWRAPAGYRTLTISTHVHRQRPELRLSGDSARSWKDIAAAEIEAALRSSVPELAELSFARMQSGSPRTFEKYTGRVDGLVGGLPLDKAIFPFRFPTPKTPFDGLYLCGDTIFPGQGLPGVTLGALAVYNRILVADR
jgi:phytoene dehydrogenase-like protein